MTDASTQGIVGVSIRDTALRLTEVSRANREIKVTRLAQGRARVPLHFSSFKDASLINKFAEDINRLYEVSDFQARHAVISLDSSLVAIKKIPVDVSLKGARLKDHVDWEVEQCVINPVADYSVAYEYYEPGREQENAEVVVAIVRKTVINFVKDIFRNTDLRLRAVDVDVFAAQRVVQENYQAPENGFIVLVDVRKENLQISLLKNDKFLVAQDIDYSLEDQNDAAHMDHDYLARVIFKELRRLILDNKIGKDVEDMSAIYIYGDHVTARMVETLQNGHHLPIERANPFLRLKTANLAGASAWQDNPETFMTSVGAALKKL